MKKVSNPPQWQATRTNKEEQGGMKWNGMFVNLHATMQDIKLQSLHTIDDSVKVYYSAQFLR